MNTLVDGQVVIREAEVAPYCCSGCFQQKPQMRHIDFGAAWDGPTFTDDSVAGGLTQSIDELVLCEDCLATADRIRGMGDVSASERRAQELDAQIEMQQLSIQNLQDRLTGALDALEAADSERNQREQLITNMTTARKGK